MSVHPQLPDEQSDDGHFQRQEDAFRGWVSSDGSTPYRAEPGRYHLYVSYACPWAHRTVIVRKLKKLEDAIGMTVVDPIRNFKDGWAFRDVPGASSDPVNGFAFLKDTYLSSNPRYRGRVTVPVLWDKSTRAIVSNNDDDIMRMFETEFDAYGDPGLRLYPKELASEIDALNGLIYETLNDGVYRAGFATSQVAYDHAAYRDIRDTGCSRRASIESALSLRVVAGRDGLATLRNARAVRRRLRWPFQMQPAAHR